MVDIQTIKIPWCKPEVIELRHRRIVVPPTPPEMSPGVEYLDDSPFQGKKEIEEGPYDTNENAPDSRAFTIPMRDLDTVWRDGGSKVIYPAPSKTLWVEDWNSSTTGEITDLTVREWRLNYLDYSGPWPPTPEYNFNGGLGISLETMLTEGLYTDLWCMSFGTKDPYPGYVQWQLNRVSSGMDVPATVASGNADNWGTPEFYPLKQASGVSQNIIPVYHLLLFRAVIQYLHCVNSEGSSHWHEKALPAYDIRTAFFAAVNDENNNHPFFKAFRACQDSYPFCQPYPGAAGIHGASDQGSESGIMLTFYTDITEHT